MTGRTFFRTVSNGEIDILQMFLTLLEETGSAYCLIGGLAVNAYAEPVVSLDLDVVVTADKIEPLCAAARQKGMEVRSFEHSVNLSIPESDLRIQIQTDPFYQDFIPDFIPRAQLRKVLGYHMAVSSLEDVLPGKVRAYLDESPRKSKRQKDLADILRLVEAHPRLESCLPPEIAALLR